MSDTHQPIQPDIDTIVQTDFDFTVLPGVRPTVFIEILRDDGEIGYVQYNDATWEQLRRGLAPLQEVVTTNIVSASRHPVSLA